MSEQRTATTSSGGERKITVADQRAAALEAAKIRADKKARFARVLERGYIVDRLTVDLPDHLHGEWVALDQVERWEALGFRVDKEHAFKRQLHPDGSGDRSGGAARVGDVIFMTCAKEDYEIMQELKHEMFVKTHGKPGEKKALTQREEREFKNIVENQVGDLAVVDEGKEHPARDAQIKDAIAETVKRVSEAPVGLAEMSKRP